MKTASAIFQRILSDILRKYNLTQFCTNYIDDILVYSKTYHEHLDHIQQVLDAINQEGFKLKLQKCTFAKNEVKYLGHIITDNTVKPIQDNLIAVKNFPTPKNKRNIRQFLGKINFYRKYIQNAAKMLEPLHALLRKGSEFTWNKECQIALCNIKDYLTSPPVLAIFNPKLQTNLYTDASVEGLGAVLKQV